MNFLNTNHAVELLELFVAIQHYAFFDNTISLYYQQFAKLDKVQHLIKVRQHKIINIIVQYFIVRRLLAYLNHEVKDKKKKTKLKLIFKFFLFAQFQTINCSLVNISVTKCFELIFPNSIRQLP